MKNQLTQDEIQKLFDFVESKNMTYKDVQYEIVDHLASAMEVMKEENPEWPYSLCLQEVYNKFPITGFALLQMEKEEALNKYWKKKLWPYLFDYFKLPKIIITITLFLGLQQLFNVIEPIELNFWKVGLTPNVLLYFSATIFISLVSLLLKKRINRIKGNSEDIVIDSEKFLYIKSFNWASHMLTCGLATIPFYIGMYTFPNYEAFVFHGIHSYLLAAFVMSLIIHWHLTLSVFPPLLRAEAEQRYAHINMKLA